MKLGKKVGMAIMLLLVVFITVQPVIAGPPETPTNAVVIGWYACAGDSFGETLNCVRWFITHWLGGSANFF